MLNKYWFSKYLQLGGAAVSQIFFFANNALLAQSNIVPDDTLSTESSLVIPNYERQPIEAVFGGAIRGVNLFHSFQEFNVSAGRGAYFFADTSIQNILARVTGSNSSQILGTLGTFSESQPNLFLMNPNGIIFSRNASLNVGGSFVATTANAIQFGNQGFFSASNPESPSPLTINPSALLFNQITTASIQNNSVARVGLDPSRTFIAKGLRVPDGQSLLLVGGNVSIDNGGLYAFGGRVELGGLALPGAVGLNANGKIFSLNFPEAVQRADVSLSNNAEVIVTSEGRGDIAIHARNLDVSGSSLLLNGIAPGRGTVNSQAGDIILNATEQIKVEHSSLIENDVNSNGTGNSGNISINAGSLLVTSDALLSTSTFAQGSAGNISINARGNVLFNKGDAFSNVEAGGVGKGGSISIKAGALTLQNGAQLTTIVRSASNRQPDGRGNAGSINIDVRDAVTIFGVKDGFPSLLSSQVGDGAIGNGGDITLKTGSLSITNGALLRTSTFGQGNAGNLIINARDNVLFDEGTVFSNVEAGGVGKGGSISIKAGALTLQNGAQLTTIVRSASNRQPDGRGNAGSINIDVRDAVTISGVRNSFPSGLRSRVNNGAIGNGGDITLKTGSLSVTNGAEINSSTLGQGSAGNVIINARDNVVFDAGYALSNVEAGGVGNGGSISIKAGTLTLQNGSQLLTVVRSASNTQPDGRGNAGSINIDVRDAVTIFGVKDKLPSLLGSLVSDGAIGNGGDITLKIGSLSVTNGAEIDASTSGQGSAGNVIIDARNNIVFDAGYARSTVEENGKGQGGDIRITAGSLSLLKKAALSTSTFGHGSAGNLIINARDNVLFDKSNVFSNVEAGAVGNGGSISIKAGTLTLQNGAQIDASISGQGSAGNVTIDARDNVLFDESVTFTTVEAGGVGNGGGISIKAGTLTLQNGAQLTTIVRRASNTQPAGRGNAGPINIDVQDAVTISGVKNGFPSALSSQVGNGAIGNGGDITLKAGALTAINGARLITSSSGQGSAGNLIIDVRKNVLFDRSNARSTLGENSKGKGGDIRISTGSLSVTNNAQLATSTLGEGSAGNLIIDARDNVLFNESNAFSTVEAGGVGDGGSVFIKADALTLKNGAQLQTLVRRASDNKPAGRGNAGSIDIDVRDTLNISGMRNSSPSGLLSQIDKGATGTGGNITLKARSLSITNGAEIDASTLGDGSAGNIQINAKDSIAVFGTNAINGSSSGLLTNTASKGFGGNIIVDTNVFRVSDGAVLDARTTNNGNGGNITVNASLFEALNGGQLITVTSGSGRAGKITVNAREGMLVSGNDATFNNQLSKFGDAVVNIDSFSGFFVLSSGIGSAGDIEVTSPKVTLDNRGRLIADSASGNGGNVKLQVSDLLLLRHGGQISTNAGTAQQGGDGGNININSKFIIAFPEENSDITANAYTGTGGQVEINSQGIFGVEARSQPTNKSDITASSELGIAGVTNINSPDTSSLRNSLNQLPENVIDTNALLANSCIARRNNEQRGTFLITAPIPHPNCHKR